MLGCKPDIACEHTVNDFCQVSGSSRTQGIALDAAANLCRHLDGDIVGDLPFICERSLALLQLGETL